MSENQGEDRNQGNFWSTLPGIITAIAALITAIGGVVAIVLKTETPSKNAATATSINSPASQPSATTSSKSLGQLVVQAEDAQGKSSYYNREDQPAKIHFKSTGKWSVIQPGIAEDWVERCQVSKEPIPPDGLSNITGDCKPPGLPCPNDKLGALIVVDWQKGNNKCLASGAEGDFTLEKGQTVHFLMNDDTYKDNEGQVTVELTKAN